MISFLDFILQLLQTGYNCYNCKAHIKVILANSDKFQHDEILEIID